MKNGNQKARILDGKGNPKEINSTPSVEEQRAELLEDLGNEIFSKLNFGTPDNDSSTTTENGKATSFSKSILFQIATLFTSLSSFISELESRRKTWNEGAKATIAIYSASFCEWASSLIPDIGADFVDGKGNKLSLVSAKAAVAQSAGQWLINLGKLSNSALRGKPAEDGKAPKPSMFDDPKRGKQLSTFTVRNEERLKGSAGVRFNLEDSDGKIRAAILEISDAADAFNQNRRADGALIVKRLTDLTLDSRFGFDDGLVIGLLQARIYGLFGSMATQAIKEAKEKQENYLKSIAADAALKVESERMASLLKADKDYKKEHSGVGGTRFQMPESTPLQPEVMNGITFEDKAKRRVAKLAHEMGLTEFSRTEIVDVTMDLSTDRDYLDGKLDMSAVSFEKDFSDDNIKAYLTEIIANAASVDKEIAAEVTA